MSTSNNTHLEKITNAMNGSNKLSEEEKTSSFKIIEEWVAEDRAFGALYEKLAKMFEPIFIELGLI